MKQVSSSRSRSVIGGLCLVTGLALGLVFFGCLSGSGSPQSGSETAKCDLALYPNGYDNACQAAVDEGCCNEQRACAANPLCLKLLTCINSCPVPRQAPCVNTCTGDSGAPAAGFPEYGAIGNCIQGASYKPPPANINCKYPVP